MTFPCFLLAILAASFARAQQAPEPAVRWTFDASADGLTPVDGALRFADADEVPGVDGKALALGTGQGAAGFVTAPLSAATRLGSSYTIEAWIYPTQIFTWNRLVLNWGAPPLCAYHLALHQGQVSLCHNQADGTYLFCEGGSVQPNRWQHIAAVATRNEADPAHSTLEVFLNGRLVGTRPFDGTSYDAGAEPFAIGDSAGGPNAGCRFYGYLDELTVWKQPLSQQTIAARCAPRTKALQALDNAQRALLLARLDRSKVSDISGAERHPGRDIGGHYYANFGYASVDTNLWMHGGDGARLCRLDVRTGQISTIFEDPQGGIRDPQRRKTDARR